MTRLDRLQVYARELLIARMNYYSEDCYCAGWMMGNEATLWEIANGKRTLYGQCKFSPEQADELRKLADDANGWWIWSDDPESARKFVTLDEWRRIYSNKWDG